MTLPTNDEYQFYESRPLSDFEILKIKSWDGKITKPEIARRLKCSLRDVFRVIKGDEWINMIDTPMKRDYGNKEGKPIPYMFRRTEPYFCPKCCHTVYYVPCPYCEAIKVQDKVLAKANDKERDKIRDYYLSLQEKEEILRLFNEGMSAREIGRLLRRVHYAVLEVIREAYPDVRTKKIFSEEEESQSDGKEEDHSGQD